MSASQQSSAYGFQKALRLQKINSVDVCDIERSGGTLGLRTRQIVSRQGDERPGIVGASARVRTATPRIRLACCEDRKNDAPISGNAQTRSNAIPIVYVSRMSKGQSGTLLQFSVLLRGHPSETTRVCHESFSTVSISFRLNDSR